MKFTKSLFGKEDNDIEKFNELDLDERSIVFYSESSVILYPYVEEIIRELQNRDQKVCYLTSSKDDPILKNKNENVRVFYIGDSELEKMNFFLRLKAKMLIMTMPDLGSYHIKRSKVFPVHYVYVFHTIASTHMEFQKGAFDEFDSISKVRGSSLTDSTERMVNQLLTELDGVEELQRIVVIAATNRPELIDGALLRPDRIELKLEVPLPDKKSRLSILKVHTAEMPLKDINLDEFAKSTEGWSGADLKAMCREAGLSALRDFKNGKNKTHQVTKKHFEQAYNKISRMRERFKE